MVGNLRQRVLIEGHLRQRALIVSHLGQRVLKVGHLRQRVLMVSHLGSEGRSPETEGPDDGSLGLRVAFIGGHPLSCPGILEALDSFKERKGVALADAPLLPARGFFLISFLLPRLSGGTGGAGLVKQSLKANRGCMSHAHQRRRLHR